jgi:hypothetical protein
MEVDPTDGSLRFTFHPGRRRTDIDETIERLLELPAEIAVERKRRAVLVFDEFQEVLTIDKRFPNLMRAVFQAQPEVSHVYLGSKRHLLERIFNDRNEPFWRSAKQLEIGPIAPEKFASYIDARFAESGRGIAADAAERLVVITHGHPYATQELAYFTWELVPEGEEATVATVDDALGNVIRSEHNHLVALWDGASPRQRLVMLALAEEPTRSIYAREYRERHELPANPTLQTALDALLAREIVGRDSSGALAIIEPFLAEWLGREERRR